jgi:hypothetical protein
VGNGHIEDANALDNVNVGVAGVVDEAKVVEEEPLVLRTQRHVKL